MARRQDGGQPQLEAQTDKPDQTAQRKELVDLHAAGELTDEGFAAAKANLLGL